ncbi:GyrI-like domain-containing protein [Mucilaginibacter gilvus]|uniref:AraC family transcriptional regulator n=1 Tax=Mucilaginibacter gilvus TaxID=2305909 RepID=A0A3S3WCI6_9SPHI|nr:GyrI-like domain-containing protein [Mucilaginibacter gilvus]RWY53690.1 AraC family transcriptional regulator [Mucilaginibacter gilvus]
MQQPRFEILPEKTFVGKRLNMSYADNKTGELWRRFMPRRREIANAIGTELYSIELYPEQFFTSFNPAAQFEKWAAVEVSSLENTPAGMETLLSPQGLYAVFVHYGPASTGPVTYGYIFTDWLPSSAYVVDQRLHFAIMGEKYKSESADSEEEIWIPVRSKQSAG